MTRPSRLSASGKPQALARRGLFQSVQNTSSGMKSLKRCWMAQAWLPGGTVTLVKWISPRLSLPATSARLARGSKVYSPRISCSLRARAHSLNRAAERMTPACSSWSAMASTVAPRFTSTVAGAPRGPWPSQSHSPESGRRLRTAVAMRSRREVLERAMVQA